MQDNLTQNLTDPQLKANIDDLMNANRSTVDIQSYIDHYVQDGKGGYTLKVPNQPTAPAPSFIDQLTGKAPVSQDVLNAQGEPTASAIVHGVSQMAQHPIEAVKGAVKNIMGVTSGAVNVADTGITADVNALGGNVGKDNQGGVLGGKTMLDYKPVEEGTQYSNDAQSAGGMASNFIPVGEGVNATKGLTDIAEPYVAKGVQAVADSVVPIVQGVKGAVVDTAKGAKNLVKGTTPEGIADIISGPLGKTDRTSILSDTGTTLNGTPQGVDKTLITGKVKPILTPEDKLQVIDVQPYITSKNPITNITNLNKGATDIAQNIVQPHLDSVTQPFNMKTISANLDKMETPLSFKADPILEKTYQNAKDTFMEIAQKNKGTLSGLWDARKQFDNLIYKEYGDKAFDDPAKNAAFRAMSDVRKNINNFIADKSGSNTFKTAMQKLSNIYDARDNIALKNNSIVGTTRYGRVSKILKDNPIISTAGATAGAILGGEKLMGK